MGPAPPVHCLFAGGADGSLLDNAPVPRGGRLNRYRVDGVNAVKGALPTMAPHKGWRMIRIESDVPAEPSAALKYYGVTQHLGYTTAEQATALAHARAEFAAAEEVRAVLIPIHKTADWWAMPHDQRQKHFAESGAGAGHAKIGAPYIERVFRRLYHSRYLGRKLAYDFLTYFEFQAADESHFRELLTQLRDPAGNPEWGFVDLEFEIWMTRLT